MVEAAGVNPIGVVEIIQSIVFFIPIGLIIWRMSALNSNIQENKKDIDGLGKKIRDQDEKIKNDLSMKLDKVENTLIELSTSMQFTQRDIEEIKTDLKSRGLCN
jgi:uncharacterized protein (DUF342 family)